MKILANKDIRNLFLAVSVIWAASLLLAQGFLWLRYQRLSLCLLFIFLLAAAAIWVVCCSYFKKQNKIMEQAVSQINVYLDGDTLVIGTLSSMSCFAIRIQPQPSSAMS